MQRCPNCGEENPDRARFCLACGEALTEPRARSEERKVVTVLFCDLVGFTARSDRADPEDVRAALRPYHTTLRREIERFGGTVEKFIGDAVMAVFGAPVAHEDDAERAVRAALRITEAIGELNEEHAGLELAVRVGINTGEAVVALGARPEQGEGIVTGDVVNTASRLQGVAPVGGIVVGEPTYRATRDIFDYEGLEQVQVKGKAEPLGVWLAKAARSRYGVDVDQDKPTPFIGRDDDLALLKQTYARTLRDSSIQLVTVTGEPGVGKTRLLAEFRNFVDDQPELVYWRQGRCLPYGEGITFWALGEMVKAHAGILESDDPGQASQKLENAIGSYVEEAADRDWLQSRLAPLVGLRAGEEAAPAEQEESFTAWRRFLEAVAGFRPLVLVFEDLHWADEAMLAFIEHLVDWSNVVPMLVVCTARPELFEGHPGWGGGKRNSTTISLAPMTEEDIARLISALLSQAVLPAETQVALLERAGGNPLYAEEFVKMLTDRGILERRGRAWTVAERAEIPVPDTVQALIAARLDTLTQERKALLQDASVVGKVFWTGTLASMGGVDDRGVRDALHDLARNELVRPARRSSVADQVEYSFWHLLVRDVAYSQIPRAARARKHRAAAEWIERMAGDRTVDLAELLAYHYGQALELALAAGSADEVAGLQERARAFLIMAGDRAKALDVGKAYAYYRKALDLLPPGDPGHGRLLTTVADFGWASGQPGFDAAAALEQAIAELKAAGDMPGVAQAITRLRRIVWVQGQTARAGALAQEAVELLEGGPPSPELASAYSSMAGQKATSGAAGEALAWSEKALALTSKLGLRELEARTLQYRGMARLGLGNLDGLTDLKASLQMCEELGLSADTTAVAYVNLADWTGITESPAKALDLYRQSVELAKQRGILGHALWATAETTWKLFELGRWDEMLQVAEEVARLDRERGGSQVEALVRAYQIRVLAERGELEKASTIMDEFLPRAREINDLQVLAPALETAIRVKQVLGDLHGALGLADELELRVRNDPLPMAIPTAFRVLVPAGRLDQAKAMLEVIGIPNLREPENCKLSARAILAEGHGELEEAIALYRQAASEWEAFGHPLETGHALMGLGRCLLATGDLQAATSALREAREAFGSLRAKLLFEEVDDLLREATALTS